MRNQDHGDVSGLPVRAEIRSLPNLPAELHTRADQVVTGLVPHEPSNFQTPAALSSLSGRMHVLTGQPGVGKTQVAAAYARQRVRDGWLVAWIGAETVNQIEAGTAELADRLSLYRPEDSAEIVADRVRNHLQTRPGRALLVFDNVMSLDAISRLLPSTGTTQVVATCTARGSQPDLEVAIEPFDEETALRFLGQATGLGQVAAAAELASEVGGLPLALAQAAARMRTARWDYATYLKRFRQFPVEKYLSRRDGDPYPMGAATAILLALEPFQDSEILEALAVLSPDGMKREMFGEDADDELALLYESSLVEYSAAHSVRMHRLVRRVIRDSCRARGTYVAALTRAAGLLDASLAKAPSVRDYQLDAREVFQSHADALMTNAKVGGRDEWLAVNKVVFSTTFWAIRTYHQEVLNFAESMAQAKLDRPVAELVAEFEEIFDHTSRDLGPDDPDTVKAAVALARCYDKAGRHDRVIAVLEEAHMAPGFGWNGGPAHMEALNMYLRARDQHDRDR